MPETIQTPVIQEQDYDDLRIAIFHLASCWDRLRQIEDRHAASGPVEVETSSIDELAADCGEPEDALKLDKASLNQWWDRLMEGES